MKNRGPRGWLFLEDSVVPEHWRDRSRAVRLVPLTPEETSDLLDGERISSRVDPADEELVKLAAEGMTVDSIASRLGMTTRNVYRRLARLREEFGVASTTELFVALAERGFGGQE